MIKNLGYSWMLSGENFDPNEVERLTGLDFKSKNNKGDRISQSSDRLYSVGIAILSAGKDFSYWPLSADDELLDAIETHYDLLREQGVEDFIMRYSVGWDEGQHGLEFSPHELQRLTRVGATLTIDCIELDEDEFAPQDERE